MSEDNKQISSPLSTGGGGVSFENRVQAAFAALMLSGGSVPTHFQSSISSIKLQRRYEDYNIDDFIVECKRLQSNQTCKLLAQAKHSVSITKSNSEFFEVISAAWSDFNNSKIFSPQNDCIALITGPLSQTDIAHVRPLLDWARHSENSDEFFKKVETPRFSSDKKREKLEVFKHHLKQANKGKDPDDDKVWQFLKCFYLIGYDFDAASSSDLSLIQSMLKLSIVETASPDEVWAKLVETVQSFNASAGTITFETLSKEIRDYFRPDVSLATCSSIDKLKEHGDLILRGIRTSIANTHVKRTLYIDRLVELANESNFVIVTGSRGSGKSAVVKEYVEMHNQSDPFFCIRTEDLNESHLDKVFTSLGIGTLISELSARFAMMPKKYLIIDSLEKLLELDHRTAFCDLLEFLKAGKEWTVIASCREYALQQISSTYLQYQGVSHGILEIDEFSEDEFKELLQDNPTLTTLAANNKLSKLLKNPFVADMAVHVMNSDTQSTITDEVSFRKAVWQSVICKESDRAGGMPAKRAKAFIKISTKRAKQMTFEIPEDSFDPDVLYRLETDGLLYRNIEKRLVRPAHDVLEDWAIEEFIEKTYHSNSKEHVKFLGLIGCEPSIVRAFRFWLHQKLNIAQNPAEIRGWCLKVLDDADIAVHWRDEIIIAILSGHYTSDFLQCLRDKLLENHSELLKRFCFLMRVACKVSNTDAIKNIAGDGIKKLMSFMLYKAWGNCWSEMIEFLYENRNEIHFESLPEVPSILGDYANLININEGFPKATREMGLLALFLLETVKDKYHSEMQQSLLKIIIKVVPKIEAEFEDLLERDVFGKSHGDRPSYVGHLLKYILVDFESAILCKYYPELVTKLAWQEWILQEEHEHSRYHSPYREVESCFGLSQDNFSNGFHPASGLKGPFSSLLFWHESKGIDFILMLCNHATERYVKSQLDGQGDYQVDVVLNDGTVRKQYCSGRLWGGYRGMAVMPYLLQSALMALENWLIAKAQHEDEKALSKVLNYLIEQSNSVMTTAVVVSIATGFPEKAGDAIWPLLRTAEFFGLDMQRRIQDSGSSSINWHRGLLSRDVYSVVYAQERDTSNSHSWRKEELEFLVCKLQFTPMRDKVYEIIDKYFKKFAEEGPDSESWRFRLARTDLRDCKVIEDKENSCIRFVSTNELEPDLQEKSEIAQRQHEEMQGLVQLFLWAEKEFEGEPTGTEYYQGFRDVLSSIKQNMEILNKSDRKEDLRCYMDGVIKASAVLIRDFANELEKSDLSWCIELLIDTVTEHLNSDNQLLVSTFGKAATAVTQILPIVLDYAEETKKANIRELIVTALTHTNRDFTKNIAIGIQKHLWQREPDFAQKCFDGAIEFARLQQQQFHIFDPFRDNDEETEYVQQLTELRSRIKNNIATVNSGEISFDSHSSSDLLTSCLMVPDIFVSQQHTLLFLDIIKLIQDAAIADKNNRSSKREQNLNLTQKFEFARCLTRHLFALPASERDKVVQAIAKRIADDLSIAEDLLIFSLAKSEQMESLNAFWDIWVQIAIATQENMEAIFPYQRSNHDGESIIHKLLFADFPQQNKQHREELREILKDGQKHLFGFVQKTGTNIFVYEDFARLVFLFPDIFLSNGIFVLRSFVNKDSNVLSGINTVFYLEHILRRILISEPSSGKIRPKVYGACLVLLNAMVEKGSTSAFFLREHLSSIRYC